MSEEMQSLLSAAATVNEISKGIRSNKTLTSATSSTRVSPPAYITSGFRTLDNGIQQNILQVALAVYIGHYREAVSTYGKVGDIRAISILQKFSTNPNSGTDAALVGASRVLAAAAEEIGNSEGNTSLMGFKLSALEASDKAGDMPKSLAVGKMITVPFSSGDQKCEFTVNVSMFPDLVPFTELKALAKALMSDNSYSGRWHAMRSGKITIADWLTCRDILREDRKLMLTDSTGIYKANREKKSRSVIGAILSGGNVNMNTASAVWVMTKAEATELETVLGGRLNNYALRQKFFEKTLSMMLIVVDSDLEVIKLYQESFPEVGTHSFRDFESAGTAPNALDLNAISRAVSNKQSLHF